MIATSSSVSGDERILYAYALPVRQGGLGISDAISKTKLAQKTSKAPTACLTESVKDYVIIMTSWKTPEAQRLNKHRENA